MALTEAERDRYPSLKDFSDFLKAREIPPDDPQIPLLKEAWNQAVVSTCLYFRAIHGTTSSIEQSLMES